ncbi:hypothetical protein AHF37_03761 [Paragonimus kellicotti]|nr:hypothetical protein AHF37_03761 [Paragonimus kellicotti]
MLAHELHSSSFGFNTTSSQKEFQAWNNYREQLVATQSLRQFILRLLQQWSVEMETDLISMECTEHNLGQSQSLHKQNIGSLSVQQSKESENAISDTANISARPSKKTLLKSVLKGLVTVSRHLSILLFPFALSHFTWTVEEVKHSYETSDLRHGFRVDRLLKLVQSLRSSEFELRRCLTKAAQFGIECELLPYMLLRLLHRAGAFTQNTGGAVLCQTDTDGYIAFGHEIVESVLYQVLAIGHMDSSEMYDTRGEGVPTVPPGVRIILTCSPTNAIYQRLSRSSRVRVVKYPVDKKIITRKTHSSRTAAFAGDLLNLSHQDEHRIAQPAELVRLLPDLSRLPVVSEPQQTAMTFQHVQEADPEGLQQAKALVRARITDPVALRAYEQWPLKHLPLAQVGNVLKCRQV